MAQFRIIICILVFFSGHFVSVSTQSPNVCKTFGSGVMQTFNKTMLHVKSTCLVILTHFSHAGVDCFIAVQRDTNGVMKRVEILVNKIATIIQDGILTVEGDSISLPYDHTYQSVYAFGIYTRLTSKVLPFSVTWYSVPEGVTSLWVQLDRPLVEEMTGICGGLNSSESQAQLLNSNVIRDGMCVIGDSQPVDDKICKDVKSLARECMGRKLNIFDQLCKLNMYINVHQSAKCSFYEEFLSVCNGSYLLQSKLRNITSCKEHHCPGDLHFKVYGAAFPPTCSNPQLQTEYQTSTCLPLDGFVLNDRVEGYHSVKVKDCPCVHRGKIYAPGEKRSSKCQTCKCINGKWSCSANTCPTPCVIEGWFVTTFDGKQYSLPGKCTYVAARGLNWTVTIKFSDMNIEELYLDVYEVRYTFSLNKVQKEENRIAITDLLQTEHVTVYWESSMFVKVQTTFGMKMLVQVSPEVQMYLYLPQSVTTAGLCGSKNNNTADDFTTSSGIVENSAQPFALSWTLGECMPNNPPICINTDNEIFAEDKCSQLTNTSGVFAQCHDYVPVNTYFEACVQRTCHATTDLQERACVGLGNYAKACAGQGIIVGDWREKTACIHLCDSNLRFDYAMQACNRTCRSLSGPDPTCDMSEGPVEGCGCPSGTHLNTPLRCSPRALCHCSYPGGTTPPGPVVIDGYQCMCENGNLQCSDFCDCPHRQICVHCAQAPVSTAQRTCESLSKPFSVNESCISGCYCPEGQYADHTGICVDQENCTCEFSGIVYASGQSVESNCKTCTCRGGHWDCTGDPCPGVCEVYGNGQYKTFDSKWYRFDGHCQYTLVEDIYGLFSIKVESVPCCDEVLTCSRAISVKLKDEVTLILRDMNVTQNLLEGWRFRVQSLYSIHTVGLYIIISVPELGLTLIWDKQTKVKIELLASWNGKVRGLCGDFDGKLMNDLLTSSSTVVFSTLEFGNSWKTAVPPCSDVTQELFPCERHSYCAAWAQRRCMILHSDTFKSCHLKVDPTPYYQACILESCSCDFEGKFLGFCTAVAAYADACTTQNVCIKWRTPDLCPVYCDYYNEEGQCSWHYEACPPQIKTCGKSNKFSGKLEGCYPRCPAETPYYDENRRMCSTLDNCTCYFNNTVVEPGANMTTPSECCDCIGGQIICKFCTTHLTTTPETAKSTSAPTTTSPLTTTKTSIPTSITPLTTTKTIITTSTEVSASTISLTTTSTTAETLTTTTPETSTKEIKTTTQSTTDTAVTTLKITPVSKTTTLLTTLTTEPTTLITTSETFVTTTPIITTITTTTSPLITNSTKTPLTTMPTTPESTTKESASTTTHISISATSETPVTTLITEHTTEELTSTSTLTTNSTTAEPTTTTSTTEITTEILETSTLVTSTAIPNTTSALTAASTETTVTTTTTPKTTTNTFESTTPIILTSTTSETPVSTSFTEFTTEESTSTSSLTTTSTTAQPTATASTTEITTEEPTTTTPLTTTSTRSTTESTTKESASTTPLISTSATSETPVTTLITELTTEEPTTTPPLTKTLTTTEPSTTTSTTEITTEILETTIPLTTAMPKTTIELSTASTETPMTTTMTPKTTTNTFESTTPFILTSTTSEAPVSTSITEFTTEEPTFTSSLTTTLTTTKTTATTSTTEITTEEPTATTPLTKTSATTEPTATTSTTEITTEKSQTTTAISKTTSSFTTDLTETPVSTTMTPKTTTNTFESTTPIIVTSTTSETPVSTSITEFTTEEFTSTSSLTTTSTTTQPTTTSTTEITTEEPTTTTPLTTNSTSTETTTTASTTEITTEGPTTPLTTTETTTTASTTEITTEGPTTPLTTTETTMITSTTEITTEGPTTPLTTTETTMITSTTEITTEGPTTPLTSTETTMITSTTETTIEKSETTTPPTTSALTTDFTETPVTTTITPKTTTNTFESTKPIIVTSTTSETPVTTSTTVFTTKEPTTTPQSTAETCGTALTPHITTASKPTTMLTTTKTSAIPTTQTTPFVIITGSAITKPTNPQEAITTITPGAPTIKTTIKPTTQLTTITTSTTPITTASTPHLTTKVSKPTTTLTTASTETPVTTPTVPQNTTPMITIEATKIFTTTETPVTKTSPPPTTVPTSDCKDLIRNQTWPEGYQWTEDCFNKICINKVIELRPLVCPALVMPVCPRGMPQLVKDEQGCCDTWQCDCQCDVFGDPHYTSFAGQDYDFLENCTYVLMEERTPRQYLSISVDNYYCEPFASCAKGITLKYQNSTVTLQVLQSPDEMPVLETLLNQVTITPPYREAGLRFESTESEVYIYIEGIRSYIFLSIWNTLKINLAMEHFFNNTQGQCGVCGGASCVRRDGTVENEDCCDKTAYEWMVDDPLKPYCQQAPRHLPCIPLIPPIPPMTVAPCMAPLCDLLRHEVFRECSMDFDVENLVRSCEFDYCVAHTNATVCSPLERLADHCKKMGFCIAWRNLTNGICDITCSEGMVFDECRSTPTDFCLGGARVPGTVLDTVRSGCFCPENQLLAETHKKICVSECTNCKGPLGEPMPVGAIWESNCHMCTCNNQTMTEECWPKPSAPTPKCSPGFARISDCCNNQICVEKTCDYNGTIYKVGKTWRDPQNPCVTFQCTREGTEIETSVCPQQFCPEELRVWDEHHCCYSCNTTCGVTLSRMTVQNCTQEAMLPACKGNCASSYLWVRSGNELQLDRNQFCCKEKTYELREIALVCSGARATQYTYKHITSCECQREV